MARPPTQSTLAAAAVALAVGLVLADSSIAVLALPAIHRELDVELGDLHWVLTAFNLALALAAVPAALLTRRRSARAAFAAGAVVFAAASAGCAAAPEFSALSALRAVQALGGAVVVVAGLRVLSSLVPNGRGVGVWIAAGAFGTAVGPALGGVLTEAVSWRAVFAVQAPLALVPLPFLLGRPLEEPAAAPVRPRLAPNLGLAFVSAGLAAALFLVVLLLIEGWGLSPMAAAAVASALPAAALATTPVVRRVRSARARAAAGALLCAGGLAALGLLPGAHWTWTLPPQLLLGAGLALSYTGLTELALGTRGADAVAGSVTVAARHAGIVLGLLALTPVLVNELERQSEAAEEAGAAALLDSAVSPGTKLRLAERLAEQIDDASGEIPDFSPAFASVAERGERAALAELRAALDDTVERAVTAAFSRPFLLAALLALASLAGAVVRERRPV